MRHHPQRRPWSAGVPRCTVLGTLLAASRGATGQPCTSCPSSPASRPDHVCPGVGLNTGTDPKPGR